MDEHTLLQQFAEEADEIVRSLCADFDTLASGPPDRPNPDLLNRVYRSAHSLKGLAGMAGAVPVHRAAQRFEILLDDMRMGRLKPDGSLFGECGSVASELGKTIAAVARRDDTGELQASADGIIAHVDSLRSSAAPPDETPIDATVDIDERITNTFTEYEEHRLKETLRAKRPIYQLDVAFSLTAFDTGFRALNQALSERGEILGTLPGAGGADPMSIGFRIIFATDDAKSAVDALLASHGGTSRLISSYP